MIIFSNEGGKMGTKKRVVLFMVGFILLCTACTNNLGLSDVDCVKYSDEVAEYQGILLNGYDGNELFSVDTSSYMPDSILLNEETGEILEFLSDSNVLKIIPGVDGESYIYGGEYTADKNQLTMTFYADNEIIDSFEYSYILERIEMDGYYATYNLHLTNEDGTTVTYIQPQWIPIVEEDTGG